MWVLLRGAEEPKLLSCFFSLCYRTVRARTMKERKVTSCKCLFHGAKQFRMCFLNLLKINTDVYANLQWKEDQIHLPVLVQRGLEKLEERETNKKICLPKSNTCMYVYACILRYNPTIFWTFLSWQLHGRDPTKNQTQENLYSSCKGQSIIWLMNKQSTGETGIFVIFMHVWVGWNQTEII